MKISIQGYKGSFHDVVAAQLFPQRELLERSTFKELFNDVKEGRADVGIVAIENSIAGAILENYNLLRNSDLKVTGEYYLRIVHNLMVLPGTKIEDLTEIWSHPMALKQCQNFLQNYPNIKQVETDDTARSAAQVKDGNLKTVGAIASKLAAEVHGLEILAPGVEDDPQNYTRFLIVQRQEDVQPLDQTKGPFKTSMYVETAHKPGGLLPVLQVIKDHGANMTMLVSRPVVGKAWEYGFYIDFVTANGTEDLIVKISEVSDEVTVLGKYSTQNP
jgi:prephenate dehydratase